MLHALNAKKAKLDRIIHGIGRQPREDLITSALFGTIEFLPLASRPDALKALLGMDMSSLRTVQLWPSFYHQTWRVEPDIVIVDGSEFHIVEVKWGAHLGVDQIERQLKAVQKWQCRTQDRDLLGSAPRNVKTLTVLGFEKHHAQQTTACRDVGLPVQERSWQEVAAAMWPLRLASDSALAAWAFNVYQLLTNSPKARTMQSWPALEPVAAGSISFIKEGRTFEPRKARPVLPASWTFDLSTIERGNS